MQKRLSTAATAAITVSGFLRPLQQLGTTASSSETTRTCWLRTEQQALRADAVSALQQLRIYCGGQLLDASADLQLSRTPSTPPKRTTRLCTCWNLISSCFLLFGRFCQVSAKPRSNQKSLSTPKLAGGHLFPPLFHLFHHCEHFSTTLTLNKTQCHRKPNWREPPQMPQTFWHIRQKTHSNGNKWQIPATAQHTSTAQSRKSNTE